MKTFFVQLTIFVAGFEKTSTALVTAPIKELAKDFAIALEAHEPESMEWGGDHVTEMGYEFAYGATSVAEVSPADAATLSKYMTLWEFDLDKLKASGNWWDSYTKDQQDEIESLVSDQDSKPDPVPTTTVTPSSHWHSKGEKDPHGDLYDCKREGLPLGQLTDDELANAVFMYGSRVPSTEQLLNGAYMPIAYLSAAKDRIRWLSRRVNSLEQLVKEQEQ